MSFASHLVARATVAAALFATGAVAFEPFEPDKAIVLGKTGGSFLGISVLEIDADRAKALNLKEERGVEVTRVEEDSPAAKGGLKIGDVVLEYNGQRVDSVAQFIRMVHETPAGREVKLAISRSGGTQTLALKTAARKTMLGKTDVIEIPRIELPDIRMSDVPRAYMSWRSTVAGIEAESLDSQLAEYFGVKEGVLVRSIVRGSAADKAGLRAGDVIVKVDDTRVTTPREIASSVRSAGTRKSVQLQIVRERREQSLPLAIDDADAPYAFPKPSRDR
jgi:serine protease Do